MQNTNDIPPLLTDFRHKISDVFKAQAGNTVISTHGVKGIL